MKKLILTVAIVASGVSTFALSNPILNDQAAVTMVMNQEAFKAVAIDQLPEAVTAAVEKDFPGAAISQAHVNSSEQYKLTLSIEGSDSTVYADKDGAWLSEADIVSNTAE
ncbi:hypothetical protein ACFFU9_08690 [Mariniflexile ostreae]|uniref:Beta-lactamase-inhibitor-like PepSY-like domain-containing protein n=1 Tax=Mariniflexile ostreae TaxID=1520892 RepID=A0ABV5FBI2_9FLAO